MEFLNTKSLFALFCTLFFISAQAAQVELDLSRAISADNEWVVDDIVKAGDIDNLDSALLQAVKEEKMGIISILLRHGAAKLSQQARTQALQEAIEGAIEQDSKRLRAISGDLLRAGDYPEAVLTDALLTVLRADNDFLIRQLSYKDIDLDAVIRRVIENRDEDPGMVAVVLERFPEKLLGALDMLDDEAVAEILDRMDMKEIIGRLGSLRDHDTFNALKARGVLSNEDEVRFAIVTKDEAMLSQLQQSLPLESNAKVTLPVDAEYGVQGPNIPKERGGHYSILFLIEERESEGIVWKVGAGGVVDVAVTPAALMLAFSTSLRQGSNAIIASRGLTCGAISIVETDDAYSDLRELMTKEWDLYNVEGTQFTVWLPKRPADYYRPIFNFDNFTRIPLDTTAGILLHCPPSMTHTEDPRLPEKRTLIGSTYHQSDLARIFSPLQPEEGVLDFILMGHGDPGGDVAGLPVSMNVPEDQRITSLLAFLNEKLRTGVVYVTSCSAGGQTELLMPRVSVPSEKQADDAVAELKLQRDYGYILIVGSISDKLVVSSVALFPQKIEEFFNAAADLRGHGTSLNRLLNSAVEVVSLQVDVHGYAGFPQVLLPGGLRFTALSGVEKEVLVAGDVFVAAHEQEERPIQIRDKRVVLWYPSVVNATVAVHPFKQIQPGPWPDLIRIVNPNFEYPEFVPMLVGKRRCTWFKNIVVQGDESSGVLHFLRDTFCDIDLGTARSHDILISSLEGINDIAKQLEAARSLSGGMGMMGGMESGMGGMEGGMGGMEGGMGGMEGGMGGMEGGMGGMEGGMGGMEGGMGGMAEESQNPFLVLTRDGAGKPIKLRNVMVRINPPDNPNSIAIYIDYDGSGYWVYRLNKGDSGMMGAKPWDFQRAPEPPPVTACEQALAAQAEKIPQKSLGQIVRQKLEFLPERALRKVIHEREMKRQSLE